MAGPAGWMETIVAAVLPPARREDALGDLAERYTGGLRYLVNAIGVAPLLVLSRIRRTTNPQFMLMEAFVLYLSFASAALLSGGTLPAEHSGLARIAVPAIMTFCVVLLQDAWSTERSVSPVRAIRGPVLGVAVAFFCEAGLWAFAPGTAAPQRTMLYGSGLSLLVLSAVRLVFLPVDWKAVPTVGGRGTEDGASSSKVVRGEGLRALACVLAVLVIGASGDYSYSAGPQFAVAAILLFAAFRFSR